MVRLLTVVALAWLLLDSRTSQPSLVGTWKSEPTDSQLGKLVITYVFAADGTFSCTTTSETLPEMKVTGTYKQEGNKLITWQAGRETASTVVVRDDRLTMTEADGDRFELRRQQPTSQQAGK